MQFTADNFNRLSKSLTNSNKLVLVSTNTWCSVEHDVVASPVGQMDPEIQY